MPRETKDLTGMNFGELYVLENDGTKKDSNGNYNTYWKCKCTCGRIKSIKAAYLLRGSYKTCGESSCKRPKKVIDITGKKYGLLTVIEMIKENEKSKTKCLCVCECGNETIVDSWQLRHGKTKSCGCLKTQESKRRDDLTGLRFGRLVALRLEKIENKKTFWLCQCDCGNQIITYATNLKSGHTESCGCNKITAKGLSTKRIYGIYGEMISRCYNKNNKSYNYYGKRGIQVCEEWNGENGLFAFVEWAYNNGYNDSLTIDRIDPNGNYEPNNCRWVDNMVQANNKRKTVFLTFNNRTMSISDWAREIGISSGTLRARKALGWTDEQIITTKINEKKSAEK